MGIPQLEAKPGKMRSRGSEVWGHACDYSPRSLRACGSGPVPGRRSLTFPSHLPFSFPLPGLQCGQDRASTSYGRTPGSGPPEGIPWGWETEPAEDPPTKAQTTQVFRTGTRPLSPRRPVCPGPGGTTFRLTDLVPSLQQAPQAPRSAQPAHHPGVLECL